MAQSATPPPKPASPQNDPTSALEFLSSYSAPGAVLTTETSHVSARPPSPPADTRLRRIEGVFAILPPWPTDFAWSLGPAQLACAPPAKAGGPLSPGGGGSRSSEQSGGTRGKEPAGVSDFPTSWRAAERAFRQGRFEQAAALYAHLLPSPPQCAPALWNRALALAYAHSTGALAGVRAALPAAPSPAAGHLLLADTQVLSRDVAGAQKELTDLAAEAPAGPQGTPQTPSPPRADRLPPAEENLSGAQAREVLWAQAMVAWGSGKPHDAQQLLARLAEWQPQSAAVWFELGGAALDEARTCSRRLAETAPDSVWNRRLQAEAVQIRYPGLAKSLLESTPGPSQESAGRESPEDALSAASDSPRELYLRTRSALRVSEMAYGRASGSALFQAYLHALRALAAEQEDDEAAARREYQQGLAQDPDSALLHAGLGHLYRERRVFPSAERELSEAWRLDPSDPVVAFELGDTEQRLGKTQAALELLNQALDLDTSLLVARWSRAKAYLTLGDNERALADLEGAAPADSSGELQWQLARLYRQLGRTDLAAQAEKRAEEQRVAAGRKRVTESAKP